MMTMTYDWLHVKLLRKEVGAQSGDATHFADHLVILYLYIIVDQRRVDIIDQVEYGVHDRLHIHPLCGIFYFP